MFSLLTLLPTAALADQGAATSADPVDLAAYMRARIADADGRVTSAAADYAAALDAAPGNATIAAPAYREAMAAGDVALATRAAAALRTAGAATPEVALLPLALAAQRGDASHRPGDCGRRSDAADTRARRR